MIFLGKEIQYLSVQFQQQAQNKQTTMTSQDNTTVRLQVHGGAGFNFILPAKSKWKVAQLEAHIIEIYNQISQNEEATSKAVRVRSMKRNGFFVAPSSRVGAVFGDWDQLSCVIVVQGERREEVEGKKKGGDGQKDGEKEKKEKGAVISESKLSEVKSILKKPQNAEDKKIQKEAPVKSAKQQQNQNGKTSISHDKMQSLIQQISKSKAQKQSSVVAAPTKTQEKGPKPSAVSERSIEEIKKLLNKPKVNIVADQSDQQESKAKQKQKDQSKKPTKTKLKSGTIRLGNIDSD